MFNVQCSSVGKAKGHCANIKYRMANTLLLSANMVFIAAGHQKAKLKIQNDDDDANTKKLLLMTRSSLIEFAP